MAEFHFLRPFWLWGCLPILLIMLGFMQQHLTSPAWSKVCDTHLLQALLIQRGKVSRTFAMILLGMSMMFMIIAMAGPTWSKNVVPTYQHLKPRLIILDLSQAMLTQDLTPDRLTRAKFKIHDLLMHHDVGQYGLLVYTGESFVVSPLTDDAQTIDVLLDSLTPSIMPVAGNRLDMALKDAQQMLSDMGVGFAEILVLTSARPSSAAIDAARALATHDYHVSVIPLLQDKKLLSTFASFAQAGQGEAIRFTDTSTDIERWLALQHKNNQYQMNKHDDIPLWQDQGRWFLLPALILLLPIFRRGWLARLCS